MNNPNDYTMEELTRLSPEEVYGAEILPDTDGYPGTTSLEDDRFSSDFEWEPASKDQEFDNLD